MKHVIIPFQVQNESINEVKTIISNFISKIKRHEEGTLMYKSFQQEDKPTHFIHVMTFLDEESMNIHKNTLYCKEFVDKLYPSCTELPVASLYNEVNTQEQR